MGGERREEEREEEGVSVRREGVGEGGGGLAGPEPLLKPPFFLIFLWYYVLPSFKEFVPKFNHSKCE